LRQNGPAGAIAVRPQRLGNHEPRRLFFATPPAEGGVRKTPSPVWRQ
jgi:hypothetical protein